MKTKLILFSFLILYITQVKAQYLTFNDSVISGKNETEMTHNFQKLLQDKYPNNDSVKLLFSNKYDQFYLFEVIMNNEKKNMLYFLADYDYDTIFASKYYKIADIKYDSREISTPSEFLYFMMKTVERKDSLALKSIIADSGYYSNRIVWIGDVSEPQYQHRKKIYRDSITFENIYFNFTPYLFSSYVGIPEDFDENGKAKIITGGGGFSEYIWIQKTDNGVFLVEHFSRDH